MVELHTRADLNKVVELIISCMCFDLHASAEGAIHAACDLHD